MLNNTSWWSISVATVGNAELDLTIAALQPAGDTLVNLFVPMSRRGAWQTFPTPAPGHLYFHHITSSRRYNVNAISPVKQTREANDFFLLSLFVAVHPIKVISVREISRSINTFFTACGLLLRVFHIEKLLTSVISILHPCTATGRMLEVRSWL